MWTGEYLPRHYHPLRISPRHKRHNEILQGCDSTFPR